MRASLSIFSGLSSPQKKKKENQKTKQKKKKKKEDVKKIGDPIHQKK
jgi:hypothetical protein